ncbi:hypothetical protein D3C76_818220 [compost metagenome]
MQVDRISVFSGDRFGRNDERRSFGSEQGQIDFRQLDKFSSGFRQGFEVDRFGVFAVLHFRQHDERSGGLRQGFKVDRFWLDWHWTIG